MAKPAPIIGGARWSGSVLVGEMAVRNAPGPEAISALHFLEDFILAKSKRSNIWLKIVGNNFIKSNSNPVEKITVFGTYIYA